VRPVLVLVDVRMEGAAAPPQEEPDGEPRDHESDRGLGGALNRFRRIPTYSMRTRIC